ncbi:hypothetical protein TNCV_3713561 [Trichonephila clavipes]|nr:hypothetical protein TNCV_3713561 [Trichonephila clavipes]
MDYVMLWIYYQIPPHDDKYETLKNALLNRLTDIEESRLKELLTDMELGDRGPSNLLRQMKRLAVSSISDELIKSCGYKGFDSRHKLFCRLVKVP